VGLAIENARLYATLKESYSRIVDTQAELVRAERLAALGELSATVAHEVRNPLAAIYNSLSQLGRLVPDEGDARTLLGIAQEEATRLNRIIGDLLLFAKPGEPDLRATPLDDVIDAAARAARQDAAARDDIDLVVRPVAADLHALCDGSQMRQALVNLIVNAFQAIEGPGRVVLGARPTPGDHSVEITVEDDGAGMAADVVERAFDPFFTTRPAGSGLGLAIVRRIVEDHRGTVEVDTIPGESTRFLLRIPRADIA
jgi:signal transduction histidine kinase